VAVKRTDLDLERDKAARELAVADNRVAEVDLAWSPEALQAIDVDLSGMWTEQELAKLFGQEPERDDGPAPQCERADELRQKWQTEVGQLWEFGEHRLLCGDCRDTASVELLMQGELAGLMNTDPPYGISYRNDERPHPGGDKHYPSNPRVAKPTILNDNLEGKELQEFLEQCFRAAADIALCKDAAWYMWHAMLLQGYFAAAAAVAAGLIIHRQIIWVKPVLLLGRGHYHWKHELCFMGWVQGHEPPDYGRGAGERDQHTVWEVDSVTHAEREEFGLPTPKPVELFSVPIIKHLKRGEVCYEPFAGTGPQFVAAERYGVKCYGMDLDPACVAVTLERLSQMGLTPKLCNGIKPNV
jgi:DNA modification methylase